MTTASKYARFVTKANKVHNGVYGYDSVTYENAKTHITITCTTHGGFKQTPDSHIRGSGCPACANIRIKTKLLKTTEAFVAELTAMHGAKYSYERTAYVSAKIPVVVTCVTHGDFSVSPSNLLSKGQGCPMCSGHAPKNPIGYANQLRKRAPDEYTEAIPNEVVGSTLLSLTCAKHGDFTKKADYLMRGAGCPKCGRYNNQSHKRLTTESFISKAQEVHGTKYQYTATVYKTGNTGKVQIVCPTHGEFSQSPDKHLSGQGCPKCKGAAISAKMRVKPNGWSHTTWDKAGKKSGAFVGFMVYVIQCHNADESFIKVGKTFVGVANRFSNITAMPYTYTTIRVVEHNAFAISRLEEKLMRECKQFSYKPAIPFAGDSECLRSESLPTIMTLLDKFECKGTPEGEDVCESAASGN